MNCEDRLEFALAATSTGMWSCGTSGDGFDCDDRLRALWGLPHGAAGSFATFAVAVQEADAASFRHCLDQHREGADCDIEIRINRVDTGAERWMALRVRHAVVEGRAEVIGTARDITDAKQHDARVHLLMREVTHRSKNLLAIIQAMARRTVKHSLTASDFEARFSARLRGLAFSHEILASQDWRGASLTELVTGHLSGLLEHHPGRVSINGPVVFVRPEAAQNLGLALNELSTNASKFGALAGGQGRVEFDWEVESNENGPRWLRFTWHETGDRPVVPPVRQGFGHEVMQRVVSRALDGTVEIVYPATGFEWSLRIPVSHIATDA